MNITISFLKKYRKYSGRKFGNKNPTKTGGAPEAKCSLKYNHFIGRIELQLTNFKTFDLFEYQNADI